MLEKLKRKKEKNWLITAMIIDSLEVWQRCGVQTAHESEESDDSDNSGNKQNPKKKTLIEIEPEIL